MGQFKLPVNAENKKQVTKEKDKTIVRTNGIARLAPSILQRLSYISNKKQEE